MAYPDHWMNELLSKSDIVTVVSSYIELKPKGRRLWGLCPVHGEKTVSFSVSPDKQLYYCFRLHRWLCDPVHHGCGAHDVPRSGRFSQPRGACYAAGGQRRRDDAGARQARASCGSLSTGSTVLYGDSAGRRRRFGTRVSQEAQHQQRCSQAVRHNGYAPSEWEALKKHLGDKGFTPEELVEAGLLVKNADSGRTYDAYRGRVIFPIIAANGRVIGFGARVLNNDDKPKYINTGDTPLYNKRNNLWTT
ncbi:MAG: CHC2 zinc finger domain-containing protein [Eubacteriales bacterium]